MLLLLLLLLAHTAHATQTCSCRPPMQSPTLGFIDDVEFFFPSDKPGVVEYR